MKYKGYTNVDFISIVEFMMNGDTSFVYVEHKDKLISLKDYGEVFLSSCLDINWYVKD